ncbi:glutamate--tRNA ligase [Patescibacteria group bacterium]|nr:glutamate--tRNA ligase [Patescibacteria group bacterium]
MTKKIRTRIAPSPTGFLHIGTARTALFNYLFAKQNNGKFILRIEDTDKERSKKEFEENILEGLKWLGLNWDEGPFYQSQRNNIYVKYAQKLLKSNLAHKEGGAIIFKNTQEAIEFEDIIRGLIRFEPDSQKDIVLIKSDGSATYNFAAVVDDKEMKITHVIRGEDHISNTPKQVALYKALDFEIPKFCHLPLILGPDKSKMSKRHGAISVAEYKEKGYLPEALINFLALLGWNPGDDREIFNIDELLKIFSLEKAQKGGAVFNIDKLNWFNKEYLKKTPTKELAEKLKKFVSDDWRNKINSNPEYWIKITELEKDRITTLSDMGEGIEFFLNKPVFPKALLVWKKEDNPSKVNEYLDNLIKLLSDLNESSFTKKEIKNVVWGYSEKRGRGNVLWPFRVALTGRDKSPDPFSVAEILGKKETLERLESAKI